MNIAPLKKCRIFVLLITSAICSCSKDDGAEKVAAPAVADSVVGVAPAAPILIPVAVPEVPPSLLTWAEVIDLHPDPKIVTDADLFQRMTATGLPSIIQQTFMFR